MADPLKLLQDYAAGKIQMRERIHNGKTYYQFGDVAYPHDARTNLTVYAKPNEYYSLESILWLWINKDVAHAAYFKDYLKGDRSVPPWVDMLAAVPAPIPVSRLVDEEEPPEPKRPKLDAQPTGQRIERILDQTSETNEKNITRGLGSALPPEKVALLNLKHKKQKKQTVQSIGGDLSFLDSGLTPGLTEHGVDRSLKSRERVWKNRTTCLESLSKDFSGLITIADTIRRKEMASSQTMRPTMHTKIEPKMEPSSGNKQRSQEKASYSRYDQERFQVNPVPDFQIDTALTFHGKSLNAIHNPQNAKPILDQRGKNVSHTNAVQPRQQVTSTTHPEKPISNASSVNQKPQKRQSRTPIIIIPASGTALITMYNAVDILQDLKYITTEEKKQMNVRRENEVLIQRRKENGATVPYRVVDNPLKFTDDEWDRVVGVFVQGPAWQFKNWKWSGNPVEVFSKICAFHLKYDDQKLDANVAKWNVNILQLSKNKRHLDKAVLPKFWQSLDRFIASHKPYLRY
uniref:Parafibromin n=1 Tax=Acrobeloides nanus TaxID=290746 RepID=A0A914CWQ4_9BILA